MLLESKVFEDLAMTQTAKALQNPGIRGLSAFDRGERLHSSFGSWFEGLDWLLPSARAAW